MYNTILVTLDTTPTDRAIIEHVKMLAGLLKSRVVLLHVAAGAAALWRGPDAGGEEVEKAQAYLDRVKAEFDAAGIPARDGTCLRRTGHRDHQVGRCQRLRPGGDEHARPPLAGRHGLRHHGHRRAAPA